MNKDIPDDLRYTKDHEWVRIGQNGRATFGITEFAVEQLGDLTSVELPRDGEKLERVGSRPAATSEPAAARYVSDLRDATYRIREITRRQSSRKAPARR